MEIIKQVLQETLKALGLPAVKVVVERPKDETHGDWSTNVALVLAKEKGKNPRELAEKLKDLLENDAEVKRMIGKVEVAGAGFINFFFKAEYLWKKVEKASRGGYGENRSLQGKKVMVEYTDPNPFKEFHIGHLMSNTIGESIARLVAARGTEVKRVNYQGDVGLHVAKSIWGMRQKMGEEKVSLDELRKRSLGERQAFLGQAYALGASKYEENERVKQEIDEINKKIYARSDSELNRLYRAGREWSLEYFETIYRRLGTEFDEYFFESEAGPMGLKVVEEGLERGVLEEGERGAVIYRGEKEGLHTRVFRNQLGLPTYEAKDLGLAKLKYERYPYDLSLIVTANEITEYFKVILTVMRQLYPELAQKTRHLPHGMMKLTTGKMSSRTGKVVTGEGLLDELKAVVLKKMGERKIKNKEAVADRIAVGALKWTVLKQQVGRDIVYAPEKMTNLEGDTGPYVQYTYARARSVLRKAGETRIESLHPSKEGMAIARRLAHYPEVVAEAGERYTPNLVANYLYELAARFNTFYNRHQIVGSKEEAGRLLLTRAVAQTLQSGLSLLGIAAVEEM